MYVFFCITYIHTSKGCNFWLERVWQKVWCHEFCCSKEHKNEIVAVLAYKDQRTVFWGASTLRTKCFIHFTKLESVINPERLTSPSHLTSKWTIPNKMCLISDSWENGIWRYIIICWTDNEFHYDKQPSPRRCCSPDLRKLYRATIFSGFWTVVIPVFAAFQMPVGLYIYVIQGLKNVM